MASRLTGRSEALLPRTINPDKLSKIRDYCQPDMIIRLAGMDPQTGQLDLDALQELISEDTAVVYFDNPSYFGVIETQGHAISDLAHEHGALSVVGTDPIALGVLAPPADYGADIACGDIQCLGVPMNFGGGLAGFIASHDEERVVMEYPSRLFGIAPTRVPGEYGFGDVAYERTSFAIREEGKEWVGTAAALWGITAGVYLALMGPQGMAQIGESILSRSAAHRVLRVDLVRIHHHPLVSSGGRTGAHHRGINRDEQVAASVCRQQIAEQDAYRSVFLGNDCRA
jgi:glycine dehydrogenase subunit 1